MFLAISRSVSVGAGVFLYHAVHRGDMDRLVEAAVEARQRLIDFENDDIRLGDRRVVDAERAGEIEITVPVHRRDGEHRDVDRQKLLIVPGLVAEDHRREEGAALIAEPALVAGAVPGVIDEVLYPRITFRDLDGPLHQVPAHLDMVQLIPPGGERGVECGRKAVVGTVVHPVPVFHEPDRFVRRAELLPIFLKVIHPHPHLSMQQVYHKAQKKKRAVPNGTAQKLMLYSG